jgi:hypothetical protein
LTVGRGRIGRPIAAGCSGEYGAVGVRACENVVLDRSGRIGPLAVDTLTALVDEDGGIAGPGVELGQVGGNHRAGSVVPRPGPDATARVGRLVAVVGISLDAEIRAPGLCTLPRRGAQALTEGVRAVESAEIPSDACAAADKEAHGIAGRRRTRSRVVLIAGSCDQGSRDCEKRDARLHGPSLRGATRSVARLTGPDGAQL